jgi:hypothetical protein
MKAIIVSGALANKPGNGGGVWERMSWVTGLRRLGVDVYFVEQIAPESCLDATGRPTGLANSINLEWFGSTTHWFGMDERSALICRGGEQCAGMPWERLLEIAARADLLVNLSGHLTLAPLLERIGRKAYVDVDPGFTQFWHVDPATAFTLAGHDVYFTIGENIGRPDCPIPTCGIRWHPVRQPAVLDDWPVTATAAPMRFTTVASWRGAYGPVQAGGRRYGLKAHEFRKYLELPARVAATAGGPIMEIALDIHPSDSPDLAELEENGWRITDPRKAAGDAAAFHRYVQESAAEFSVAQGIYVDTNSGWFSDRSVRYLASGKPVLVQDTGFGRTVPAGEGLLSFRNLDEATTGVREVVANYPRHSRAARAIAEEFFASDKVLKRFLEDALT